MPFSKSWPQESEKCCQEKRCSKHYRLSRKAALLAGPVRAQGQAARVDGPRRRAHQVVGVLAEVPPVVPSQAVSVGVRVLLLEPVGRSAARVGRANSGYLDS